AGQRLQIFVDHDDTSTDHELHGVLEIATKEPLRERVVDDPPDPDFNPEVANTWVNLRVPADTVPGDLLVTGIGAGSTTGLSTVLTSVAWNDYTQMFFERPNDRAAAAAGWKIADGADVAGAVLPAGRP